MSIYIYIYIYVCVYVCVCAYTYIYIYMHTQGKNVAITVSTFCSPKSLSKRLWVNKKWKRLLLRFGVLCYHVVAYAHTRQDRSNSRFHVLFTQSLLFKALGGQKVETGFATLWRAMLSCSSLSIHKARSWPTPFPLFVHPKPLKQGFG